MVEPPLEADRRGVHGAHAGAAERAGDVAGINLHAVRELEQPLQAHGRSALRLRCRRGQVGARRVADEQRVARDQEPGLVAARAVDDGEATVLRPVARRVHDADRDLTERELLRRPRAARRSNWASATGCTRHRKRRARAQAAVTRDVVRMGMRLEDARRAAPSLLGLVEVLLDCVGRVDDDRLPVDSSPIR